MGERPLQGRIFAGRRNPGLRPGLTESALQAEPALLCHDDSLPVFGMTDGVEKELNALRNLLGLMSLRFMLPPDAPSPSALSGCSTIHGNRRIVAYRLMARVAAVLNPDVVGQGKCWLANHSRREIEMDVPMPQIVRDYIHDSTLAFAKFIPSYRWADLELGIHLCEEDELGEWSYSPVIVTAKDVVVCAFQLITFDDSSIGSWEDTIWSGLEEELSLRLQARNIEHVNRNALARATIQLAGGTCLAFACKSLLIRKVAEIEL